MKKELVIFDKSFIETFAKQIDPQYVENAYEYTCNILYDAIDKVCAKRPIVTNYSTQIVNECYTYAETQKSTLDIFVKIESPQLELCAYELNKSYFKKWFNNVKIAWQSTRKPKKRNKKKNKTTDNQSDIVVNKGKYTLQDFKIEVMNEMAKQLTNLTNLYNTNRGITILAQEEIGMDIRLFFVFDNGENYKIFNQKTFGFTTIDFGERYQNITKKDETTQGNYITALRIFNGLYLNIMNQPLNQILIESLLNNCADELFVGSSYEMFIKLFNFLYISDMQKFCSITDENIKAFDDKLNTTSYYDFMKFLKNVSNLI